MKLIYAPETLPEEFHKSVFLAGPTPRSTKVESWRKNAIEELEKQEYDGVVFIPEPRNGIFSHNYEDQVQWEEEAINMSDVILFWIPRDIEGGMPAFTTNHEHGEYFKLGKSVLGFPENADKMRYLEYKARKENATVTHTLEETVKKTIRMIHVGANRKNGERQVPIHIWRNYRFQTWYQKDIIKNKLFFKSAQLDWVYFTKNKIKAFAMNITTIDGQLLSKAELIFSDNIAIPDYCWEIFRDKVDKVDKYVKKEK